MLNLLQALDITVPPRTKERKKGHAECSAIAQLLSALSMTGDICCPIELRWRDRPDFLLLMGNTSIGIEHTRAVTQNEAYKDAIREEGYGPNVYWATHAEPGGRTKKRDELILEIEANIPGNGWVGDAMEQEWAKGVLYFARSKLKKLPNIGFDRFDEDWLLIEDNLGLPGYNRARALRIAWPLLKGNGILVDYRRVFVLSGTHACEFRPDGSRVLETNYIWK